MLSTVEWQVFTFTPQGLGAAGATGTQLWFQILYNSVPKQPVPGDSLVRSNGIDIDDVCSFDKYWWIMNCCRCWSNGSEQYRKKEIPVFVELIVGVGAITSIISTWNYTPCSNGPWKEKDNYGIVKRGGGGGWEGWARVRKVSGGSQRGKEGGGGMRSRVRPLQGFCSQKNGKSCRVVSRRSCCFAFFFMPAKECYAKTTISWYPHSTWCLVVAQ